MAKVGTAEYDVEISRAKVQAEVDQASRQIEQGFDKSSKKVSAGLSDTTKAMAAGFAAFAGAKVIGDSIAAASDLAETQAKVGVVFEDSAEKVRSFADGSAQALGQSENQALSAAATYGNLLRSIGLTDDQAAEFSTTLTGLASDLASFNNTGVDQALEAIRSGLVGETEPLKAFGVNLNEATLKAKALELGLADGKTVLDANAKAQAAYALIMEQTTLAQGDFERTSDGLANQQRILNAEWQDSKAKLGEALVPAAKVATGVLSDLLSVVSAMPPELQAAGIAALGLAVAGPQVAKAWDAVAASMAKAQVALGSSVGQVGRLKSAGLALVAGAVGYNVTYKALERLTDSSVKVTDLADNLRYLGQTGEGLGDVFGSIEDGDAQKLADQFNLAAEGITGAVDVILAKGEQVPGAVAALFGQDYDTESEKLVKASKAVETLDEELANLAKTDPEAAVAAFEAIKDELLANGVVLGDITDLTPKYGKAIGSAAGQAALAANAADEHTAALEAEAEALKAATDAATDRYDRQVAAIDADLAVNDAVIAVADAYDAVAEAERNEVDAARGVADAQRDVADAREAIAEAHRSVEQAQRGVVDAMRAEADAAKDVERAVADVATAQADLADRRREAAGDSDDMRDALEGVARAEEQVAQADRDSLDAQRELDQARADYTQTLADLSDAAGGAADDVLRAEIALRRAQREAAELGRDGEPVSADDRTEAEIAIRDAQRRLNAARQEAAEAAEELARNEANGAEGSDAVVAAHEAVQGAAENQAQAHRDLEDAVQNVADVQVAADQAVSDAEQVLAEKIQAVQEAQQARIDAHGAVVEAQNAVAAAVGGVRDAEADLVEKTEAVGRAQQAQTDARQATIDARNDVAKAIDNVAIAQERAARAHFEADGNAADYADSLRKILDTMDPNSPKYIALMQYLNILERLNRDPNTNGSLGAAAPPGLVNAERIGTKGLYDGDKLAASVKITADQIAGASGTSPAVAAMASIQALNAEAARQIAKGEKEYKQWLVAISHLFGATIDMAAINAMVAEAFPAAVSSHVVGTPFNWGDEIRRHWAEGGVTFNMPDLSYLNDLRTNGVPPREPNRASLSVTYAHVTEPDVAARQTADLWAWEMSQAGRE